MSLFREKEIQTYGVEDFGAGAPLAGVPHLKNLVTAHLNAWKVYFGDAFITFTSD